MTKPGQCIIEDCREMARTRGLCTNCYQRAINAVRLGRTIWEELEEGGLALKAKNKGTAFMMAFDRMRSDSDRSRNEAELAEFMRADEVEESISEEAMRDSVNAECAKIDAKDAPEPDKKPDQLDSRKTRPDPDILESIVQGTKTDSASEPPWGWSDQPNGSVVT